tara:strand:- start:52 stop:489 length:438 start_codon:yes stop_codon:yes gene_type:complete
MRSFESRTSKHISKRQNFHNKNYKKFKLQSKLLTLNISHKIIDYFNLSLFCLITIYSFIAFTSQRKWTEVYSSIIEMRLINNDLNGYISKTEEYFLNEVDMKNKFKKATSKDLIYLKKPSEILNSKFLFSDFLDGLQDGKYQRGY